MFFKVIVIGFEFATMVLALMVVYRIRFQGKQTDLKTKILRRYSMYLCLFCVQLVFFILQIFGADILNRLNSEEQMK